MNKKFSTLMLGMLLTSAFASAQTPFLNGTIDKVSFDEDKVVGGTYFVVASNDATIDATDQILSVVKNGTTLNYGAFYVSQDNFDQSAYEWTLEIFEEEISGNYYYALKNTETGTYLTFPKQAGSDSNSSVRPISDTTLSQKAENGDDNTSLFMSNSTSAGTPWKNGDVLYAVTGEGYNALRLEVQGEDGVVTLSGSTNSNLYLCKFVKNDLNSKDGAATLNKVKGGEGFNFDFSVDNKYAWSNDILTDLNLKAFYVDEITIDETNRLYIPAGIYFASEYPASLIGEDEITDAADFKACTFVAVNPV